MRCPYCRQVGVLDPVGNSDVQLNLEGRWVRVCHRRCPNSECQAYVFVAVENERRLIAAFPPETIDFDTTGLTSEVVASMNEAITCHANHCYRAAAIMVRRTLEDVCRERSATGGSLKERIEDLGKQVVLPPALLDGLHNLRFLGNDAAHIEAQTFVQVGEKEVELAIDVAKAILLAVYQYQDLVQRLTALQAPPASG